MKLYEVISPEYGTHMPILDDGTGPTEYGCDYETVYAENKRDALTLVVRLWLQGKTFEQYGVSPRWARDQVRDGLSPYAGVTVKEMPCWCDEIPEECPIHNPPAWLVKELQSA